MSGETLAVAPPSPIDPPPPAPVRPWWGMGDVLLMIPIMALVFAASFVVLLVVAAIEGVEVGDIGSSAAILPASMIVLPTFIQQAAWFGWPFIVSRWKGLGTASDWGLAFKPVDVGIGIGTAFIALFAAGIAAAITTVLVGLEDESLAENTQLLTDHQDSPWLYGLLMLVVSGAPLSEELLFRGLVLRSIEKRLGIVAAVIGSVALFTVIHPADGGIFTRGQLVLWSAIGSLAVVLTMAAVKTGRLAAPMIAHTIINAFSSLRALGHLDGLFGVAT